MIGSFLDVVKSIDGTGSTQLLVAILVPGVFAAFVWPRKRAWALRWFAAGAIAGLALALPVVAHALAAPLNVDGTSTVSQPKRVDAIVIFDGDNRRGRLRAARESISHSPSADIWVLGTEPEWFRRELPNEGVPTHRVRYETSTDTTRAQVAWVDTYRREHPNTAVAVVVSRLQAARVARLAAAMNVREVPIIAAPVNREPAADGVWQFVPSAIAWRVSRDAIYEHAALLYYARNGWVTR